MLTKNDLRQIGEVVRNETEPIKKDVKALRSESRYLRKSINLLIEHTEGQHMNLKKRVVRIEDHLALESV